MPQVWPFYSQNMVEALSFYTHIIDTKDAEQRIAMRTRPRRMFNFTHPMKDSMRSAAQAMVIGNEQFYVADRAQLVELGPISAGSAVAIDHPDLEYADLYEGRALIQEAVDKWEIVSITNDSNGFSIDTLAQSYNKAWLYPLVLAAIPSGGFQSLRSAGRIHDNNAINHSVTVEFEVLENNDLSAALSLTQYQNKYVLSDCPVIGTGQFTEADKWDLSIIDNSTGIPQFVRRKTYIESTYQFSWRVFTKLAMYNLRKFFHVARGRQKSFWLSTMASDLIPASSIGSSDVEINIFTLLGLSDLGRDYQFHIEIKTKQGQSYYRQVTSATAGADVGGKPTLDLTISSSLGVAVSLGDISRISFLRLTRLDADRIEISHNPGAGSSVTVQCREVRQ